MVIRKVVGVVRKTGTYQGNDYDNYMIHCLVDSDEPSVIGSQLTEQLKVPAKNVSQIMGHSYSKDDWSALVGRYVRPIYTRFGKVEQIEITD